MAPALDIVDEVHTPNKIAKENQISAKVLEELLSKLSLSKAQDEINAASTEMATFVNGDIEEGDAPTK